MSKIISDPNKLGCFSCLSNYFKSKPLVHIEDYHTNHPISSEPQVLEKGRDIKVLPKGQVLGDRPMITRTKPDLEVSSPILQTPPMVIESKNQDLEQKLAPKNDAMDSSDAFEDSKDVKDFEKTVNSTAGSIEEGLPKAQLIFDGLEQGRNIDSRYGDYTNQNGTVIISRTVSSFARNISIVIDPRLQSQLPSLDKCSSDCKFTFSDDPEYIATHADSFISPESDGIIAQNTALHFTKVHFPVKGKDLNTLKWRGTDIYTSLQSINPIHVHDNQIFTPPLRIIVHRMAETRETLLELVDFSKKKLLVTVLVADCTPSATLDLALKTIRDLENRNYSVNVFPQKCYPANKNQFCSDADCSIKISTAAFLFDDSYDMKFTQTYFWKCIRYGTYVFYHWPILIDHYAPGMCYKLGDSDHMERLGLVNIEYLKDKFSWKEARNFPDSFKSVIESNEHTFPCQLCEHVRLRKFSTAAMLKEVQGYSPGNKTQDLGILAGLIDEVYVAHYSKSRSRATHMTKKMSEWKIEPRFILAFDKQDIAEHVFHDIYAPNDRTNLFMPVWAHAPTKGELSLSTKMFWAYYWLLVNNHDSIMLFEDDIELQKYANFAMIKEFLEKIPKNYAVAQMGSCLFSKNFDFSLYGLEIFANQKHIVQSVGNNAHCTSAYAISKQGALLLFKSLPLSNPIDWQMMGGSGINHPDWSVYGVWPPLFVPSEDVNQQSSTDIRDEAEQIQKR